LKLNAIIDHTLLKADAATEAIITLCAEALTQQFAAVCINPCNVAVAARYFSEQSQVVGDVKIATVIGFPLGATLTSVKAFEVQEARKNGADEFDMVINIGWAKMGQWQAVTEDIRAVVTAASGKTVKVILETGLLTDDEKRQACRCAMQGGAQFVKTSTGFGPGGATVKDIELMREVVGDSMGIKASGGIRTKEQALQFIAAGATRIGTSQGVVIVSPVD